MQSIKSMLDALSSAQAKQGAASEAAKAAAAKLGAEIATRHKPSSENETLESYGKRVRKLIGDTVLTAPKLTARKLGYPLAMLNKATRKDNPVFPSERIDGPEFRTACKAFTKAKADYNRTRKAIHRGTGAAAKIALCPPTAKPQDWTAVAALVLDGKTGDDGFLTVAAMPEADIRKLIDSLGAALAAPAKVDNPLPPVTA